MPRGSGHSTGRKCVVRTLVAGSISALRRSFCAPPRSPHIALREQPHNTAHDGRRSSFSGIDRRFDDAINDLVNALAGQAEVIGENGKRNLFAFGGDGVSGKRFDAA
jgi:hypothetical protein